MTAVIVSYADWYDWAKNNESTLAGVADSNQSLIDAYDEAFDTVQAYQGYLTDNNFRLLVYRLALHILIVNSGAVATPILTALYAKYKIASYAGIVTAAGSGPTSSSKLIPGTMQTGDAETLALFATPSGKQVESVYEQLRNIVL